MHDVQANPSITTAALTTRHSRLTKRISLSSEIYSVLQVVSSPPWQAWFISKGTWITDWLYTPTVAGHEINHLLSPSSGIFWRMVTKLWRSIEALWWDCDTWCRLYRTKYLSFNFQQLNGSWLSGDVVRNVHVWHRCAQLQWTMCKAVKERRSVCFYV